MKNPEPFIVDILCKNVNPMSPLEECHVIGCAITNSSEKASAMIQDRLISECFVTIIVSSIQSNTPGNTSEPELIQRAHKSPSLRSLMMIPLDSPQLSQGYLPEHYSYSSKMSN